jgi:hypothetical protein
MDASSRGSFFDHARTRLATGVGIVAGCSLIGVSLVALDHSVLRFSGWPVEHRAGGPRLVGLPSPGTPSSGAGISALLGSRPVLPGVTSAGDLRPTPAVRTVLRPVPRPVARHRGTSSSPRPSRPTPSSPAPTTAVATPAPIASPAPGTSATTSLVAAASPTPTPPTAAGTLNRTATAHPGRGGHGKRRPPELARQAPGPPTSPPPPQMTANPVVAASDPSPPPGQGGRPPGQLKKGAGDAGPPGERRGQRKR